MAEEIDRSNQYLKVFKKDGTFVGAGAKGAGATEVHGLEPNTIVADGDYKLAFDENADKESSTNISDFLDAKGATVPPIHVTGIALDKTTLALETGQTATLKATLSPANATNKAYSWSSDNTAVAAVDSNGKVTAVKAKDEPVNITATTKDGSKTAQCAVTIKAKAEEPPAEG
ncbi:hypothetical protein FC65_GL001623 [Ligilactobacillus acidipiscis DSM 15836]|uniref:BIG2 domain-containing protein n=1 Tax=Ligilactobacillus acidipiscis DSM 15836 TaxID=1423716 RepID=A0ABR5PKD4_9LACO|nr:Ig-like domain-containing protein [Ligilactobacillus acidipiscis]KRM28721.1 hypothetical protein FC65_GL001623 [Ligilactobacillus acidipiscis DSM 15836]GAW63385.1 hypothetical protein Lacidipiscis_00568 [Ligilactobacillus acidipiscis]GEN19594.1 hypothetical protein LAC02_28750 [Ligilactobacillus acidipiscis]